jgi:hypothetical protein
VVARAVVSEMLGKSSKNTSVPWENPRTGAHGTITPLASANTANGQICQDFLASYVRDGNASWLQGEACRAKPGRWEVRKRNLKTEIGDQIPETGKNKVFPTSGGAGSVR